MLVAVSPGCGGASQAPPQTYPSSELTCLVTLDSECCTGTSSQACIGTFSAAEECASWAASADVAAFPAPCAGMTAVRVTEKGSSYASFYVYDASGALYAIGDDSASPNPASDAIACGAGPAGFLISSECAAFWLGTEGAIACTAGTTAATSICH